MSTQWNKRGRQLAGAYRAGARTPNRYNPAKPLEIPTKTVRVVQNFTLTPANTAGDVDPAFLMDAPLSGAPKYGCYQARVSA